MSIFQPADQAKNGTETAPLNDLVGEGKKFKTVDDLARGKLEADRFVDKLTNEQKELRAELAQRLAEIEALKRGQTAPVEAPKPTEQPPVQKPQTQDLNSEVERIIQQREQAKAVQSNIETVTEKMTKTFGTTEKAAEVVMQKARELGMSTDELRDMAANSPKAFFRLMGVDDKPVTTSPGTTSWGNVRSQPSKVEVSSNTAPPGSYKYYENLRLTDPAKYFSPRVQLQMDKDAREAKAQGRDFFNS